MPVKRVWLCKATYAHMRQRVREAYRLMSRTQLRDRGGVYGPYPGYARSLSSSAVQCSTAKGNHIAQNIPSRQSRQINSFNVYTLML